MSAPTPAGRVRARFMRLAFWMSAIAFVVIEGDALLDQSEIGHASVLFMFGTACLAAAACLGLFAIIMAIGLAVSAAISDEPSQQQLGHQDATPDAMSGIVLHERQAASAPGDEEAAAVDSKPFGRL